MDMLRGGDWMKKLLVTLIILLCGVVSSVQAAANYDVSLTVAEREAAARTMFTALRPDYDIVEVSVGSQDAYGRFAAVVGFIDNQGDIDCYQLKIEGVDDGEVFWTLNAYQLVGGARPELALTDTRYTNGSRVFVNWNKPNDSDIELFSSDHPKGTSLISRCWRAYISGVEWVIMPFKNVQPSILSVIWAFFYTVVRGLLVFVPAFGIQFGCLRMMTSTIGAVRVIGKVGYILTLVIFLILTLGIFAIPAAIGNARGGFMSFGRANNVYRTYKADGTFKPHDATATHEVRNGEVYTYDGPSVKQPWQAKDITKLK